MNNDMKKTVWFFIFLWIIIIICVLLLAAAKYDLKAKNALIDYMQEEFVSVDKKLQLESVKSEKLAVQLEHTTKSLDAANETILALKNTEYELVYMGNFKITYYCDEEFKHICGDGNHITASGKRTEVGVTAAADWKMLPKGTIVYIEGIGFREIQDVGGSVNGSHIDVLVQTHKEALKLGVDHNGVWVLVKKSS